MIDVALRIQDWATKHVKERARLASKAHSDALASSGFRLRQLTQAGMRQQAPGDVKWPEVHPWSQRGGLAKAKRAYGRRQIKSGAWGKAGRISANKTPLSRLVGAVRYEKQVQGGPDGSVAQTTVRMGFINPRVAARAAYHAESHTVQVTPKMRRFLFAAGFGIRKSTITIPARPHVEPVYRKNPARIAGFVQQRINTAWAGGDPKGIPPTF
jgi:hypothetical protein